MRILFVWPGAEFSVWDVAYGLRAALRRQGHDLRDYYLTRRMQYHGAAMKLGGLDTSDPRNVAHVSKQASENIIVEALYHKAEWVIVCCGLNLHPLGLRLLRQVRIPCAVVFTESPYEDPDQVQFIAEGYSDAAVFTNDAYSAQHYGWQYLPHAYDPEIHQPARPDADEACDVLFVGTGWEERQRLLEAVDWTGITLRLRGIWPFMQDDSPLKPFHADVCINNGQLPRLYASAKICLNLHRAHPEAVSLNPRAYELAACGAFQITDRRREALQRFGSAAVIFHDAADLGSLIRHYLDREDRRREVAHAQRAAILGETFDERAAQILRVLTGAAAARAVTVTA